MYVATDDDGRVTATTDVEEYAEGMSEFDFPEGFDFSTQDEWRIVGGELIHDPLPPSEEGLEAARLARQHEQVVAVAMAQVAAMDFTETTGDDAAQFRDLWPEWKPDTKYKFQQPLQWKGKYYRTSRALTSSSFYPPDTAGESEYYPIEVAEDGIIVYRKCHGSYDSVRKGERRHYPGAEGPVYRSLADYNAYAPDVVPDNWKLVTDTD